MGQAHPEVPEARQFSISWLPEAPDEPHPVSWAAATVELVPAPPNSVVHAQGRMRAALPEPRGESVPCSGWAPHPDRPAGLRPEAKHLRRSCEQGEPHQHHAREIRDPQQFPPPPYTLKI